MGLPFNMSPIEALIILVVIIALFNLVGGENFIYMSLGIVLGVFLTKGVFFDFEEQMGWAMFWDAFKHKQLSPHDFKTVLKSTTFMKSLTGGIVGGALGIFVGNLIKKQTKKENKS